MTTHRTKRWAGAALLLTAVLAGCGKEEAPPAPPEPTGPTAAAAESERCYKNADAEGPQYTSSVDCEEPHRAEVFAVLDMPADAQSEERSDYATETPIRAAWVTWAEDACAAALAETTEVDRLAVNARFTPDSTLPAIVGNYSYSLTPVEEWEAGIRQTVCTYQFGTDEPIEGGYALENYLNEEFPSELRSCYSPTQELVPCSEPHLSEAIVVFDAEENLGNEFVSNVNPQEVQEEVWTRFDALCTALEGGFLGGSREDVTVTSDIVAGQWDPAASRYQVTCKLQGLPEDTDDEFPLLTGSLVDLANGTLPVFDPENPSPSPSPTE